jgi:hypothetical protein
MQIDKLSIVMYCRNSWEAFDLGCRMAVTWCWPLYGFMFFSTLPLFILCCVLSPDYGVYLLWLFKPWFERGLLYIYSRQVFGQRVSVQQALRAWPAQIKPSWFASLSWLRFSPSRAFDLPVAQLEGLSGDKRTARLRVLHQTSDDNNYWWLLICLHWELFITIGLVILVNMLVPQSVDWDLFEDVFSDSGYFLTIYNICLYIGIVIVAPLYVGGSFAAYLNRRTVLEGWDIELGFKKIRNRWQTRHIALLFVFVFSLYGYLGQAPLALAQSQQHEKTLEDVHDILVNESSDNNLSAKVLAEHQAIKQRLAEILNESPFDNKENVRDWRWTGWQWEPEELEADTDLSAFIAFFAVIAKFAEVILWAIFIIIFVWLLWLSRHKIVNLFDMQITRKSPKAALPFFSRTYKKSVLPSNIPAALSELFEQKAYRQLMSLLLVSGLTHLHQKHDLVLVESMTELECLAAIRKTVKGDMQEFMSSLIDTWIALAWAHHWPSDSAMKLLCDKWCALFAESAGQTS